MSGLGVFIPTPDHGPGCDDPEWVASLPEPGGRHWYQLTYEDGRTRRVAAHTESSARIFGMRPLEPLLGRAPGIITVEDTGKVLP